MDSFVSENVAAEKVDAMRRFEGRRNFLKFLPAVEALVAVLLVLYWLTSTFFAGEYLRSIISSGLTGAGIYIFGVVNVLIALIFSLSNHQKLTEHDLYFQYVSSSAASPANGLSSSAASTVGGFSSPTVVSKSLASEKTSEGMQGTDFTSVSLTAGEARPMKREMVRAVSSVGETAHAIRRKREMTFLRPATTESTATDHHVYRRSRSERIDVRGDLHRSMRRLCDIDDLSSDEFRSTVETFIAGKKKMLSKEWVKP
ncbi:unnamed protein product [Arabidopsis lyrata]|uniref:Transmembrane protein n=1 Tax=Arabidopsis lyrata subsp. lyrata TaxID=81972 RepID=D7KBT4_ARALL|nr:uncharacterized protein LOC9326805 [Arabidopsis lyrata subsp. lyrata]EFH69743.1 hypothetical protein ARALYDRAFT_890303 [Arabidopsis lyrata subsp. lyrata]CAH8253705.1 unnamed protein product [Arabidopsis lyrata]|eukprot:XP_002893484.1 uncharacterized protein LOC9326805 [Arabidopsis lyrata subsp. lyrata]